MTSAARSRRRRLETGDLSGGGGGVEALGFFLENSPGAVFGAVVDDDDFVRDVAEVQLEMQMLDG